MAYKGKTETVSCAKGGLTGATNVDDIPNYMMMDPSRNLVYEKGGRRKRGGSAHLYAAAYTGTPIILGLKYVCFDSGTSHLLAATDDGDIYRNDTAKINASALGTLNPYSMEFGSNKVFIADGVNVPLVWTGAGNAAAISEPSADFTTYPVFQLLKHTRGLSERMCALNRRGLFISSGSDMEKFVTGGLYFYIYPGDGQGLTGMAEMGSEIIVFSKKRSWRLDDSSLTTTEWGLNGSQWEGGAASWRLIVKTVNDIICMQDDGEIYSVEAANTYGDYKRASITRDSWMHDWIKSNVDLSKIAAFHAKYDHELRAIRFFVIKLGGSTTPETCLLYYVDRPKADAWMIEDNPLYASGYNAHCSEIAPSATGGYVFYTGDNAGEIWKLNQTNRNDNSNGYYGGFKTPPDSFQYPEIKKHYKSGTVLTEAKGDFNLSARVYVDGVLVPNAVTVDLAGAGIMLDDFMLDDDELGDSAILEMSFGIGKVGHRIQYEFYNTGADEDFFINGYSTDYKPMGRPSQGGN